MTKGKRLKYLALSAALVFSFVLLAYAADKGPETIQMKSKLWPAPTKAQVTFSHKKHNEEYKLACDQCHHVYKDGKNTWKEGDPVQLCDACHTEATTQGVKKLPPDQLKLNLYNAIHVNCQGCHQKMKKDKPDSKAPTTCSGCHPPKAGEKAE